jgi:hypothetical protein
MKYVLLFSLASLFSITTYAEGEKSSPNIDCCHTGLCRNDIPLCPGVTRKAARLLALKLKIKYQFFCLKALLEGLFIYQM